MNIPCVQDWFRHFSSHAQYHLPSSLFVSINYMFLSPSLTSFHQLLICVSTKPVDVVGHDNNAFHRPV
jgi:hypothetical protein